MLTHSALLAQRRHKSHKPVKESLCVSVSVSMCGFKRKYVYSDMLPHYWVNVKACVHFFCALCVCTRALAYMYVSDVCFHPCVLLCVCVTDIQRSSDQPGTSSRQRGQSHSLIILTFLHNDPTHNSLFSVFFSFHPSICITHAFHFTPSIPNLCFLLDFISLITSFSLLLFCPFLTLDSSLTCWLYSCMFSLPSHFSFMDSTSRSLQLASHFLQLNPVSSLFYPALSTQMSLCILALSDPPVGHQINLEGTDLRARMCTVDKGLTCGHRV